ncbi:hypothetical protein [Yersinia pseudotuberculosis]|uniref:hypothetical protein n=1 Tax=Yersinia pseudotuberculosis TaxID=633 RepID=UPI0005E65A34|nr:hypothetical protein [Yersinia pseudotuberculosis]CND45474.1 Uncharacterised protein [Yersinia pseudotuberculosis]
MDNVYQHPQDIIRPLAVFLETMQFLNLDPKARDLSAQLLEYSTDLARAHTHTLQNGGADHE